MPEQELGKGEQRFSVFVRWHRLSAYTLRRQYRADHVKLDEGLRKCHRDALKAEDEFSGLETPKAKIECQAFTRDDGGTMMSIWIDDDRDEPK